MNAASAERDLLGELWLYVNFRWITTQLTTAQKELWADCIDEWQPDPEHPDAHERVTRWWRDQAHPENTASL